MLTVSDGFLYLALQDRDDLAIVWFPVLFVGTNVAYLALAVPFGRLADRFGRARVLVLGHVFLVGAYLCVGGPINGPFVVLLCLLLLGAFYASTDGVLAAATVELAPSSLRGTAIATAQSVVAVARRLRRSPSAGCGSTGVGQSAVLIISVALLLAVLVAWTLVRGLDSRAGATR